MNWFNFQKKSQQLSTIEEQKTDIGGNNLPPVDNTSRNDDNDFEPNREMLNAIYKWVEEGNAKNISKLLIDATLGKFEYQIYTNFKLEPSSSSLTVSGYCLLTFEHLLSFQSPELSILTQQIKNIILQSNIWKYLGIPYENAFRYVQNQDFIDYIIKIIGYYTFARDIENKECAFWSYTELPKYTDEIKNSIFNHLKQKFPNLDYDSIRIFFPSKPTCRGSCPENLGFVLSSYNHIGFVVNIWKFEQKLEGNSFEKLDINTQRSIVSYLDEILESVWEEIFNGEEDINISYNEREETVDIYPDNIIYSKNIFEEEGFKYLLEENRINQDNIKSVLESIPQELLSLVKCENKYEVPMNEGNYFDAKIILKPVKIEINNNMISININISS